MWKQLDWQLLSFVTASVLQENWFHGFYVPKVYYFDIKYSKSTKK